MTTTNMTANAKMPFPTINCFVSVKTMCHNVILFFFIISVIKIVICFIHYKNNDTFAEINCEKRMVMSWGKTILGCLIGGYALLGLLGGELCI